MWGKPLGTFVPVLLIIRLFRHELKSLFFNLQIVKTGNMQNKLTMSYFLKMSAFPVMPIRLGGLNYEKVIYKKILDVNWLF